MNRTGRWINVNALKCIPEKLAKRKMRLSNSFALSFLLVFFFKNWPEKKAVQFGSYQWRNPKKLAWGNGSYDGEAEEESLDERKCI